MRRPFLILCLSVGVAWTCGAASAQTTKTIKVTVGPDGVAKVVDESGKEIVLKVQEQPTLAGRLQIQVQGDKDLDKKQLEQLHLELQKLLQDQKPGDTTKVIKIERKATTGGGPGVGAGPAPGGVEKKLDLILKQLDELRKDVDGIKKRLDGGKFAGPTPEDKAKKGVRIQFEIPDAKDPAKVKDDVRKRLEDAIKKLEAERPRVPPTPPTPPQPDAKRVEELQRAIDTLRKQIDELKKAK